jgi:hypothetical protein
MRTRSLQPFSQLQLDVRWVTAALPAFGQTHGLMVADLRLVRDGGTAREKALSYGRPRQWHLDPRHRRLPHDSSAEPISFASPAAGWVRPATRS